jgi:type I restriction enzyme S subunit
MVQLSFKQTSSELMVRAAATVLFSTLERRGVPLIAIGELSERPQYGFTARATLEPVGPKFVRITDLQDGKIHWASVPFCKCEDPEKYKLRNNDVLFARTGATTGKTYLVRDPEFSVFASYLIRLRPKPSLPAGYLYSFFQSDSYWSQISEEKEGSAQPNVNGEKLVALKIPSVQPLLQSAIAEFISCVRNRQDGGSLSLPELPEPLVEQRGVVARIEGLAAQIQEAVILREEASKEVDALCRAIVRSDEQAKLTPMHDLVRLRPPDVSVRPEENYQFAGVYCFGRGVFRGQLKSGIEFAYARLTRLHTNNFVYPKLMAWEGAFGVVPRECDGCVVSTEFPVFEVIEDRVFPEVLDTYFRTPSVWPDIAGASTGTNVRRRRLNPNDFLAYQMPLPSRTTQERLRKVRVEVDRLKHLQAETAVEIDALMPSILDKAFRGEL